MPSPTLGKASLRAGLIAGVLGLILVMLYVAIYYRSLGLQTWIGLLTFSALIYALVVFLGQPRVEVDLDAPGTHADELREGPDRGKRPLADDPDVIAYVLDLGQHVRRKEHRRPGIPSFADELVEDLLMQRIEPAGRLVEDQHRRTVHERDHQNHAIEWRDVVPADQEQNSGNAGDQAKDFP